MIRFEHVNKTYGSKTIFNDFNVELPKGKFIVLIGPSGCGKTTMLKMINRLIEPDNGAVYVDGKDISKVDSIQLRRSIGYVIQHIGLFPNMTIAQNISVVPKLLKFDKSRCEQIVHELLELVDMPYSEFAHKYPTQLSGGQQQRIGVLRALAASPPIVLMDEPFGALDPMTRMTLQDEVKSLQERLQKTIVFVTHDMDEALALGDIIVFMDSGKIVQMASPEEMLRNPANSMIREFMGKRSDDNESAPQSASDVMQRNVIKVFRNCGLSEAVNKMKHYNIDTLIVVNNDMTYAGTVSIKSIMHAKQTRGIESLIYNEHQVVYVDEDAQSCFDALLSSSESYLVVLNRNNNVAGILTRTSVAKALAQIVWRDDNG
ncbi:betaine/proline/choline family ABC transporter ATP-binding protein [Neisseria sp. Ec49-e6-T10]|uniref:betaine/proline/choline family ABC transporter ATP-binding protein n=1 Tax=Neisseria sp. Ec49-e6-T10 TaxID=3140744 RepID=UPI003EBD39CD